MLAPSVIAITLHYILHYRRTLSHRVEKLLLLKVITIVAMSTISKRKGNEASIIRSFRYRNEKKQLILTIFFIETKRCSLVQKVSISKRSEQIYHKTLQYRNETIEIVSKLHSIVAKRTGLFSNLAISKRNERTYFKTA